MTQKNKVVLVLVAFFFITGLFCLVAVDLSHDVLDTFGTLNKKIDDANKIYNDSVYSILEGNSYLKENEKVVKLDSVSGVLVEYLEELKQDMYASAGTTTDYEVMDKSVYLDELFFDGNNISEKGLQFKRMINDYRLFLIDNFKEEHPSLIAKLEEDFNTSPELDRNNNEHEWLHYHFEGFPLIASATKLSQLQNEVKAAKIEILGAILSSEK